MSKKQQQKRKQLKLYARLSSLTFQMAIIIGGGAYFGSFIDSKVLNDNPIFTIIFSLISIFIALYVSLKSIINK